MPNSYFYIVLFMAPLMLARYSFKLYLDSKSMHMRTIAALSMAVDAKDHYTQGHSRRVAYYSEAIARAMHKSPSFVADVKTAALLHDVGKIGIDDCRAQQARRSYSRGIRTNPAASCDGA